MHVVDTSHAQYVFECLNDYMLPCGYILQAHNKHVIHGGECEFVGHYDHHRFISTYHSFNIELYNGHGFRRGGQHVKFYRE